MARPPKKFHPYPFHYHEELVVEIDSLTNLGDGVARVYLPERDDKEGSSDTENERWVIFVPFVLPGERVRIRVFRNDKNHSRADLLEVLEASPDRVTPKCKLFGECGGCQYQHMAYAKQLEWKTRQVAELLQHHAGVKKEVLPCRASPQIWEYRSKITPHFSKPKEGKIGAIGFLPTGRRSGQIDVDRCEIAMSEINEQLPSIRQQTRARAQSYKRGGTLLLRATEGRVETNPNGVASERVGSLKFDFLAGDFFQNNPFILEDFTSYVATQAQPGGLKYLVDSYCGSGLFSLCLASKFEQVAGVEISETSADWGRHNARQNGIKNVSFLAASAEAIFADITFPATETAVVIDPPRKGCSMEFLEQLLQYCPARVVYVSCNPATQVRDMKILLDRGYLLEQVQPFDLFPHTRHLECVMTFVRV